MKNDPLLQPFQLKHLTLKNRIMTTAHEPAYPEDGLPKARYRAYHEERAKGGVALTMTAGSAIVSRDSPPSFNNILAYRDEVVPWLGELVGACKSHGAAVMIQLTHLGRRTHWSHGDWLPIVSPSHVREPAHRGFPKQLEDWDIARIISDYGDAAERMQAAGVDGIELEAYGHLLDAFWSPRLNTMPAPYGGSFDNRLQFTIDVITEIRKRVGLEFIVGIRFTADECIEGGVTAQEGLKIARRLKATGYIDFLNVIRGHIDTDPALTDVIPVQGMASAPHLDFAGTIRKETGLPTFHAAKISDVATARHAVAQGILDMVGMTRAHIADPHIVQKVMEGREEEIRPCVGATYCLDRIYQGGEALCIHNAATGRELTMPHVTPRATEKKKIVVVGAGPGGMEAARVASERGHKVIVFEAAPHPGGQIRLTAQSPRRRDMMAIIDWRMSECMKRGVDFRFNTLAGAEDVSAEKPDVIIIATGGLPDTDFLEQGSDLVSSSWDILTGDAKPSQNILIFDDAGDHAGMQAAEICAASGAQVEIMTPDRSFAPDVMGMNLTPYLRTLQNKTVRFTVTYRLSGVRRQGNELMAIIGTDYSDYREERGFDQVIVNHGTMPLDDLYFDLKPHAKNLGTVDYDALLAGQPQNLALNSSGTFDLFRIGDAIAARNTHAAIYDALRLMKDI